jgi:thiol-disulfide isomerase/thioredoxin
MPGWLYLRFGAGLALVIAGAWFLAGVQLPAVNRASDSTSELIGVYAFSARTSDGKLVHVPNRDGRWTVLNFWATWCLPCEAEIPVLESLHTNRPEFEVIGVAVGESAATLEAWGKRHTISYAVIADEDEAIASMYPLRGIPQTILIAPDGVIHETVYGPLTPAHFAFDSES